MSNLKLGPVLALSFFVSMQLPAKAADDHLRAASMQSTLLVPCRQETEAAKTPGCKLGSLDRVARKMEQRLRSVLAKASPFTQPLIKRDQVWFNEMVGEFAHSAGTGEDADGAARLGPILDARIASLESMNPDIGPDMTARWENAFGHIIVTSGTNGALHFRIETGSQYGPYHDHHFSCHAEGVVASVLDGWWEGKAVPSSKKKELVGSGDRGTAVRIRRQGDTLRIVAGNESGKNAGQTDCDKANQITGTYFFVGNSTRAKPTGKSPPTAVVPSFDCVHPSTAADEEICADPDLAANDIRMNQAWLRLLPRLDAGTLANLKHDQIGYVHSQAEQYVEFMHPAWDKQHSYVHHTGLGRDKLEQLQRERIALLEGFDHNRVGLEGLWLAHNAILRVTVADGRLKADGWKWDQGDWKAGCDYAMEGAIQGGNFVSDVKRTNPDTLEIDGASLVVNSKDDQFSAKRGAAGGKMEAETDEPKCKRNSAISSAARLFPTRSSPDIDRTPGEIR